MGSSRTDAGHRLACRREGNGPPVALVHGFTQTGRTWAPVAASLSSRYAVLAPDLPGHGESPVAAGDLHDAARQLGECCGRATYVGYSLGGRVCLHLALDEPRLVERLVLVSTSAGIEDLDERAERREADELLAERIESGGDDGLEAFLTEWLSGPLFEGLEDSAADLPSRRRNTAAGLASSLRCHGTGTQVPLWERLRELEMPVLVVAGEKDARYREHGERLAAATGANATFVVLTDAGHAVPLEQPEAFSSLVADFITATR